MSGTVSFQIWCAYVFNCDYRNLRSKQCPRKSEARATGVQGLRDRLLSCLKDSTKILILSQNQNN